MTLSVTVHGKYGFPWSWFHREGSHPSSSRFGSGLRRAKEERKKESLKGADWHSFLNRPETEFYAHTAVTPSNDTQFEVK